MLITGRPQRNQSQQRKGLITLMVGRTLGASCKLHFFREQPLATASAWWFNAALENAFVDIAINRAVACYLVSIIICFVSRYDKPILYSCGSCKRSSINRACRRHFTLHIRVCMAAPACPPFNYKNRDGENDADEPHHDHWYNPGNSIISSCFSQVKILSQLTCRC